MENKLSKLVSGAASKLNNVINTYAGTITLVKENTFKIVVVFTHGDRTDYPYIAVVSYLDLWNYIIPCRVMDNDTGYWAEYEFPYLSDFEDMMGLEDDLMEKIGPALIEWHKEIQVNQEESSNAEEKPPIDRVVEGKAIDRIIITKTFIESTKEADLLAFQQKARNSHGSFGECDIINQFLDLYELQFGDVPEWEEFLQERYLGAFDSWEDFIINFMSLQRDKFMNDTFLTN